MFLFYELYCWATINLVVGSASRYPYAYYEANTREIGKWMDTCCFEDVKLLLNFFGISFVRHVAERFGIVCIQEVGSVDHHKTTPLIYQAIDLYLSLNFAPRIL